MKHLIFYIFGLFSVLNIQAQDALNIVASASMIADIASEVVGDSHEIEMIVPIGGDPHLHEPTPSDARLVADADLILINGLTFEGWINELIENSGTKAKVVVVTDGVKVLSSQTYKNSADPHAWMDAANGAIYAKNIAKAISELDIVNAGKYAQRLNEYQSRLKSLDQEIQQKIMSIPEEQRILITSHDAFQYYGRKYGIQLEAIMGISTEAEAQTADIMRVSRVIREKRVPAIFVESTINPKLIEQLAKDNKVSIGGELFADSLGDSESEAASYIDMLRYNTETIVKALTKQISGEGYTEKSGLNYTFLVFLGLFLFAGLGLAIYFLNQ